MGDRIDLERFVDAQAPVFDAVMAELRAGRKQTHWMWFIFPQIAGLGQSAMARRYALADAEEARAFLTHPLLGKRLRQCVDAVTRIEGRSAHDIFGSPDDLKFRSCVTLFQRVAPDEPIFGRALNAYFGGKPDPLTLDILEGRA